MRFARSYHGRLGAPPRGDLLDTLKAPGLEVLPPAAGQHPPAAFPGATLMPENRQPSSAPPLAGLGRTIADAAERYFPDAFVFALAAVLLAFLGGMLVGDCLLYTSPSPRDS